MKTSADASEVLMAAPDVAIALGVPVATLAEWYRRGQGPPAVQHQDQLYYRPAEVSSWIRTTTTEHEHPGKPDRSDLA